MVSESMGCHSYAIAAGLAVLAALALSPPSIASRKNKVQTAKLTPGIVGLKLENAKLAPGIGDTEEVAPGIGETEDDSDEGRPFAVLDESFDIDATTTTTGFKVHTGIRKQETDADVRVKAGPQEAYAGYYVVRSVGGAKHEPQAAAWQEQQVKPQSGLTIPGSGVHTPSSELFGGIHPWARLLVYFSAGVALLSLLASLLSYRGLLPWLGHVDSSSAQNSQKVAENKYALARDAVWKYVGFLFLLEFLHRAWSFHQKFGPDGLAPASSTDQSPWFQLWGSTNENAMFVGAWLGVVLAFAMLFWQGKSAFIALGLFVLQVSFANIDGMAHIDKHINCEFAFLAIALYPIWHGSRDDHENEDKVVSWISEWTSFVALLLLRFNTFRIVFEAGLSKVEKSNSDQCWNDFSCAKPFYAVICPDSSWCFFNYNLPETLLTAQTLCNHLAELSSIWFVFCSHRHLRHAAAVFGIIFQVAIWLSGHFGLINIATATGFIACFDDAFVNNVAGVFAGGKSKEDVTKVDNSMDSRPRGVQRALSFFHMVIAAAVGIVFLKNGFKSVETMAYSRFETYEPYDAQWHVGTATYSIYEHLYRRKISTAFEMQHGPGTPWTPLNVTCPAPHACHKLFGGLNRPGKTDIVGSVKSDSDWSLPGTSDRDEDLMKLAAVPPSVLRQTRISGRLKHVLKKVLSGDVAWASHLATPLDKIFVNGEAPTAIRWRLVQHRVGTWGHLWNTGNIMMTDNVGEPFGILNAKGPPAKPIAFRWPHYEWLLTLVVWQVFLAACAALDQKIHGQGPVSLFMLLSTLQMLPNILAIPPQGIFEKSAVGVLVIYGFLQVVQQFGSTGKGESPDTELLCSSRLWSSALLILSVLSLVLASTFMYALAALVNFAGCIIMAFTAGMTRTFFEDVGELPGMRRHGIDSKKREALTFVWPRGPEASLLVAVMATFASVGCCAAMAASFPW